MAERAYLDWNATAPLCAEARAAMAAALDLVGNPSSVHGEGRAARTVIEDARRSVAELAGAMPENVVFTSGGTEANALALTPAIEMARRGDRPSRLLISAIEHPSVLTGGRFETSSCETIPVTNDSIVDLDALRAMLALGGRALVSVMLANNETGVIQPVRAAADMVHEAGGLLHVDAVQAPGRIPVDITALGADLLTLSAHKFGGPKGAGALVRAEAIHLPEPLLRGGGQERGARGGTENVAAIAGFGAAAGAVAASYSTDVARMTALRERMEHDIRETTPEAVIFGSGAVRLPNTTLFALRGMKAETAVIAFDLNGVAVSSGSACSSGKVAPSHVLAAMKVEPALAAAAIRVSIGPETSETEVEKFRNAWKKLSKSLVKGRTGLAA